MWTEQRDGRNWGKLLLSSMGLAFGAFPSGRFVGVATNEGSGLGRVHCIL